MSSDDFYWYASIVIFLPWALLIFVPNWRRTELIAFIAAILLFLVATWFTLSYLGSESAEGNLWSLNGFENLFRSKEMLLTGWLNYLSFCLLVGIWQVHDARQENIPHLLVVPSLLLTLVTGPAGLLVYLVIRFFKTKKWEIR